MKRGVGILGVLMVCLLVGAVNAEKLSIEIENNYLPGDDVIFKITLYDDNTNKIEGQINYKVWDYLKRVISEGVVNSGEEGKFKLPANSERGLGVIIAQYQEIEKEEYFNIQELEKAEIKLEGDTLIITNIGNTPYSKPISIFIGDKPETALVPLAFGESKQIKLTAPAGEYTIRVSDGTEENTFEERGVSLTGNVIGLEKIGGSFWTEYPLVVLFLIAIGLVVVVVLVLKVKSKGPH